MARGKKRSPEQVVNLLRQIELSVANGKTTSLACKEAGITDQTYYRLAQGVHFEEIRPPGVNQVSPTYSTSWKSKRKRVVV